jgi:hypothetical protein
VNQSAAIIIAGALLAAAVTMTNHWQIVVAPAQNAPNPQVYRLDRWTGRVSSCSVINQFAHLDAGVDLPCEAAR